MKREGNVLRQDLRELKENFVLGLQTVSALDVLTVIGDVEEELERSTWRPISSGEMPQGADYVLVSFANCPLPDIARYEVDEDGSVTFYHADSDVPYSARGIIVNAWRPLPERYDEEDKHGNLRYH